MIVLLVIAGAWLGLLLLGLGMLHVATSTPTPSTRRAQASGARRRLPNQGCRSHAACSGVSSRGRETT